MTNPRVAIIWAQNYLTGSPLPHCREQVRAFVTQLLGGANPETPGCKELGDKEGNKRVEFFNSPPESPQAENFHYVYMASHGDQEGPFVTDQDDTSGSGLPLHVLPTPWGRELRTIVFDACNVLGSHNPAQRWKAAFNGLHRILGFASAAPDPITGPDIDCAKKRAEDFARRLLDRVPINQAWQEACEHTISDPDISSAYLFADYPGLETRSETHEQALSSNPMKAPPSNITFRKSPC